MKMGLSLYRRDDAGARTFALAGIICGVFVSLAICKIGLAAHAQGKNESYPELHRTGRVAQLYVQGKPFLVLGGELGNSSASDLPFLDKVLKQCQRMNLNTVMLPVYWDSSRALRRWSLECAARYALSILGAVSQL
jgi:hypothetical protein